eukprot:TRINITY_DN10127_c0_g1_i2.p1 TRINITY_DN10127_c0_g1~~TRINITY_DN10127_c0_g1_i2.p1  ORF type:complete len:497 (+),score=164.20 TRINITY_DN10127_c0_g1_i2:124-1614(+)
MGEAAAVAALHAEVAALRAELAEERRLRVFLMAGVGQRLARIEEKTGAAAEDGGAAPPARPASQPPTSPSPATPLVSTLARTSSRNSGQEVAFAAAQAAPLDPPPAPKGSSTSAADAAFAVDDEVWVMCLDGGADAEAPTWDPATVAAVEGDGFFTVRFADGEQWDRVHITELRSRELEAAPAGDAAPPPAEAEAEAVDRPATPPAEPPAPPVEYEASYFAGWVQEFTEGWVRNGYAKHWMVLKDGQLGLQAEPTDVRFLQTIALADATFEEHETYTIPGDAAASRRLLIVKAAGKVHRFITSSDFDAAAWRYVLKRAIYDARPAAQTEEARARVAALAAPLRPTVPPLPGGQLPEVAFQTASKAYVVVGSDSWMGGGFGRRYVTLHAGWLSYRYSKDGPSGLKVIPLRDAALGRVLDNSEYPFLVTVGAYLGETLSLAPDTSEQFVQWCVDLEHAYLAANPEAAQSPLGMNLTQADLQEVKLNSPKASPKAGGAM